MVNLNKRVSLAKRERTTGKHGRNHVHSAPAHVGKHRKF